MSSYAAILKAEKLYYTLEYDRALGKELFFDLANKKDASLEKLLPGEMSRYVEKYDDENDRYDIYIRLVEIERRLNHLSQAAVYGQRALTLAEKFQHDEKRVDAMIELHNCTWGRNPPTSLHDSLTNYLEPALKLCQTSVPVRLPRVEYETGFTHSRLQDYKTAIIWYERARDSVLRLKANSSQPQLRLDIRQATILNDLGFAYSQIGDYARSEIHIRRALEIRQQIFADRQKELESLSAKASVEALTARQDLASLERGRSEARLRVGMSHNTLGRICRFRDKLEESVFQHEKALAHFIDLNEYYWQAIAYIDRGEVYRRLADKVAFDQETKQGYLDKAKSDLGEALLLIERHRYRQHEATVLRRLGRYEHDLAMELKEKNPEEALAVLKSARSYFEQALQIAQQDADVMEELENLAEIAFLVDDQAEITNVGQALFRQYKSDIDRLAQALAAHHDDESRIYQYPVFANLLELELGAFAFVQDNYEEALDHYIKGFTGLAQDRGYGSARYHQHISHLTGQIEKITDGDLAVSWCNRLIETWETTRIPDTGQTLAQAYPGLVAWCDLHKSERILAGLKPSA
jgi:tetratricopeptide (TPR) repeat protein